MTFIRRSGSALLIAAAMSLPTLASAEQAPSALCDGEKVEQKPQQSEQRANQEDKSKQKSDDKSDSKAKDKPAPDQSGKTS